MSIHHTTLARQSLLRIAAAAFAATTITWLGGMLFGPVADTRARQLAVALQAAPAAASGLALASSQETKHAPAVPSAGRG